jgi:hypothetical protein
MDIRFFGRLTALMLIAFAIITPVIGGIFNRQIGSAPWYALGAAVVIMLLLFRGWGRVGAATAQGAQRAAPHVQAVGHAVGNQAKSNPAATMSVVCLVASVLSAIFWRPQPAMFFLYASILFGIVHWKGADHFGTFWREYWLAASIIGALHSLAFGYGWKMVVAFALSAMLATIAVFGGWNKTFTLAGKGFQKLATFFGKLLFGGYGRDVVCLGWMIVSLIVAVALPALVVPGVVAGAILSLAAFLLGVYDRLIKKK